MSTLDDFSSVIGDIKKCQKQLAVLHAQLTSPDEKTMLGQLMEQMETARQEAEQVVPETVKQIEESCQRSSAKAKEQRAEIRRQKKQLAKRKAEMVAAKKKPPVPRPKRETRVDPKLGSVLRQELLEQFAPDEIRSEPSQTIKEAWEDWQ